MSKEIKGSHTALRAAIGALAVLVVAGSALVGLGASSAQAISGVDFMAGSIISDAMFYDAGSMSSAQIQGFIQSEEPSCSAGYTCLASYSQATTSHAADSHCGAYTGEASQLASDIIYSVAQACGINPQVLVVLVQKEQGLVTASAPSAAAYQRATGYGCPDSTGCNSAYYGFQNQIWDAAHQFKVYQASPTSFNFRAGQNNTIAYSPNAACGTTTVFIQNQATAGLYDYTPYVPDAAALANPTGLGDSCSAYGNRNFWVYFTEWFGNSQGGGSFAKSATDPTIYLLTADHKYPVPNQDVLNSYWALGPYRTVSDSYLAEFTTGAPLGQLIRDPTTGAIYYSDLGIKHHVLTCAELVNYATSCSNYIDLLPSQIQELTTGADLNQFARSATTGAIYYVTNGVKRWIHSMSDVLSLNAGVVPSFINLSETALATIPDGPDYVAPGTMIQATGQASVYLLDANNRLVPVPSQAIAAEFGGAVTQVSPATIAADTIDNSARLTVMIACGTSTYLEGSGQLWKLSANSTYGLPSTTLDPTTCANMAHASQSVTSALFLRSPATGAIYYVANGKKAHMETMAAVNALNGSAPLVMIPVSQATLDSIATGPDVLGPTQLVKSATNTTVYMVDGLSKLIPIDLFQTASEFGVNGYTVVADSTLATYTAGTTDLTLAVTCGTNYYMAGGGQLWQLASKSSSGLPVTALDPLTCGALSVSSQVVSGPLFVRSTSSGAIYLISGGNKVYQKTIAGIDALNGGTLPVFVPLSDVEIAKIPG